MGGGEEAEAMPWRTVRSGLSVRVRVTPKSSRDAIEGIEQTAEGPALKARVRAVPEDGAANAAVEKLVAAWLGVAKGAVTLSAGGKSRIKTLAVSGEGPALAEAARVRLAVGAGGRATSKEKRDG
jgi:uncharacterized protein YggU (UPF0235/DUF167 family)